MSEDDRPEKKPPRPLDRRAVADGARNAVQGNNHEQTFDRLVDEVRKQLLINDEPQDSFTEGVQAERHWRDHICPDGQNHGLGPFIPVKPPTRKLAKPGELVEFEEHHVALFEVLTKPLSETLGRFVVRLHRREAALGWVTEWWKWVAGFAVIGFGWAQWGREKWPEIKAGLLWLLAHLQ